MIRSIIPALPVPGSHVTAGLRHGRTEGDQGQPGLCTPAVPLPPLPHVSELHSGSTHSHGPARGSTFMERPHGSCTTPAARERGQRAAVASLPRHQGGDSSTSPCSRVPGVPALQRGMDPRQRSATSFTVAVEAQGSSSSPNWTLMWFPDNPGSPSMAARHLPLGTPPLLGTGGL